MKKIIFVIISLACVASFGYCQEGSLKLTIKSDKEVYEIGEEIEFTLELTNISGKEIEGLDWEQGFTYEGKPVHKNLIRLGISGIDEGGNKYRLTKPTVSNVLPPQLQELSEQQKQDMNIPPMAFFSGGLQPGESYVEVLSSNDLTVRRRAEWKVIKEGILPAGIHTLTAHYEYYIPEREHYGVTSNTISIEVLEKKDQIYTVEKVLDGKTLRLDNGEEVSLIGIDFPELFSQKVSDFTKSLVEGKEVRLEFDVKKRDGNGRLLAYVWYEIGPKSPIADYGVAPGIYARDDKFESWPGEFGTFVFLNATLIKAGHASPITVEPNVKYAELFQKLYEDAWENKRGLRR